MSSSQVGSAWALAHAEGAGLAVGLEVDPGDEAAVVEEREHVVAVHPLRRRDVDLDAVVEVEEPQGAVPLPHHRVERRQQRRGPHPARQHGLRVEERRVLPALDRDLAQRAVGGELGEQPAGRSRC